MENLIIAPTNKTPKIEFIASTAILKLSGRVIPESSIELFEPLKLWFEEFKKLPPKKTYFEVQCEYLNEDAKFFILLFNALIDLNKFGFEVTIKWFYEPDDTDILEAGEDYEAFSGLPFEFQKIG